MVCVDATKERTHVDAETKTARSVAVCKHSARPEGPVRKHLHQAALRKLGWPVIWECQTKMAAPLAAIVKIFP
jgi:hypothetical protein